MGLEGTHLKIMLFRRLRQEDWKLKGCLGKLVSQNKRVKREQV